MGNELKHLAVILDGNGRWAEKHGLPRLEGHKRGAERVDELIRNLKETSVDYLTLYVFSTENWSRSDEEVSGLMDMLSGFLDENMEKLREYRIRLLVSGRRDRIPAECLEKIDRAVKYTAEDYQRTVIFALNYGGRQEIVDAVQKIACRVRSGELNADEINEQVIADNLYQPDVPDPDLLIRTSGELRLSNFLLWESSYTEFYFTDILWPDFDKAELEKAIESFHNRKRRFGGRK